MKLVEWNTIKTRKQIRSEAREEEIFHLLKK